MRKLLSILLLALFSFPLVSPLLASAGAADGMLPACCRKNGKHHCQMSMDESARATQAAATHLSALVQQCPFYPRVVATTHADVLSPTLAASIFAGLVSHPAGSAQTESKWRIARDRSRQKRGPPSFLG